MSAWGAQKRSIDDLVEGVESGRLACVVVLSGRVFDDAAAVALAAAMRSPTCKLKELRCSGHALTAVGAAALGRAAGASTTLETLDAGDATLGDDGAQALALCFRCPALKQLHLEAKGIGDAGVVSIAAALSEGLDRLDLARNDVGEQGIVALGKALEARERPLRHLDVSGCLQARRVPVLAANVVSLRCADLTPGAFDCIDFAPGRKLFRLDVSNCGLDAASIKAIAEKASSLVELRYANNADAGDAGAEAVAASDAPLDVIDASGTGISSRGAIALIGGGAASIFINDNAFGDDGIKTIAEAVAAPFLADVDLRKPPPDESNLRTLGMSKTGMTDTGAIALAAALARSAVETVEVGGNKIGDVGAKALRAAEADRAARPAPGLDVAMLDDRRPQNN